jgi:hypothetical protein
MQLLEEIAIQIYADSFENEGFDDDGYLRTGNNVSRTEVTRRMNGIIQQIVVPSSTSLSGIAEKSGRGYDYLNKSELDKGLQSAKKIFSPNIRGQLNDEKISPSSKLKNLEDSMKELRRIEAIRRIKSNLPGPELN